MPLPQTAAAAKAFTTFAHPFGVFVAGQHTSVRLAMLLNELTFCCPDFVLMDSNSASSPIIVLCRRQEDEQALFSILTENNTPAERLS